MGESKKKNKYAESLEKSLEKMSKREDENDTRSVSEDLYKSARSKISENRLKLSNNVGEDPYKNLATIRENQRIAEENRNLKAIQRQNNIFAVAKDNISSGEYYYKRAERAEQNYIDSLPNDAYRFAYKQSKNTDGMYVSPYFSKGIEGKEKLKYNNDKWNKLPEATKKKYLEWAQQELETQSKSDKPNLNRTNEALDYAMAIVNETDQYITKVGDMYVQGTYNNKNTFDADQEVQIMLNMMPQEVRNYLATGYAMVDSTDERFGSPEAIKAYLSNYYSDDMIDKLSKAARHIENIRGQQERNESTETSMEDPFYATALSQAKRIGADIFVKPVASVIDNFDYAKELEKGIYGEFDPLRTEAQKIAEDSRYIAQSTNEGLSKGGQFVYNLSVSGAESLLRQKLAVGIADSMPFVDTEKAAKVILPMMVSSSVFNDSFNENIQKGMPIGDAGSSAFAHAITESLFEELSFDKLGYFDTAPVLRSKKEFLKAMLKAGFVEGSEEAFTDIANELYDHYAGSYDFSEYKAFKDKYLASHPDATDAEVWWNFTKQFSLQVAQSFAGGALSSFALSATHNAAALNRGEVYIQNGQNVSDADYARMNAFVEDLAKVNPNVANELEQATEGGEDTRRGFVKMKADEYSNKFNKVIESADSKDKLNLVMNNVNSVMNGAISEDTFNTYNAKLVELGETPADYNTFVQNRQRTGDTTFSDLAYGRGDNAIQRNIVEASKSIGEAQENANLSESERETAINELRGKVEQNVKKAEDMVARYAQMGKALDSPEVRQFESILGLENMAQIYSAGKIASENKMLPSVTGRSGKLFAVDKTSEGAKAIFGDNIGHIQDVPFSELQKTTAYSLGKVLAKMTGVNIAFYKSDRQKVQNGAFHRASNTIYIDVNAGTSGADAAVGEAFSHELTHWLRANNEEGYQRLLDFVRTDLGDSYKSMLKDHMDRLGLDEDVAGEEIVAEACQRMLKDSETFKRYAATDMEGAKTLLQRLVDFVRKLRDSFKGSLNNEATRMISDLEGLQQTWETALQEAISEQTAIEGGIDVETFEDTAVRDSIRTVLDEKQQERVSNMLQEKLGVDKKTADEYIENEQSIASLIFDNIGFLDYKPDERYEAIKKNSDYPQGTVDMTNLCRKRAIFTQIFDSLQEHFPNRLFNAMDIADIREVLKTNGYQVACALCFVEDRRQRVGEIAESFIERLKASNGKTLTVVNSKGETKELFMTKDLANTDVARAAGFKYKDAIKVTDKYIPNQYDLVTYEGFKELSKNHPQVAAAFTRANNYLGMSSARLVEGRAEYKRDILKYTPAQVKRINNKGGLRIFSFSDFEAVHLLDICQVIMDASAVGLKIQAYTKVPAFAKLVANTGIKLNRSLIAAGKGFKVNPDGSRSLIYDTHEGIDINDPDFFDSSDNPNIGNILVGISDEHIRLAMEDDFVDYIIPFHSNQGRNVLAVKGISHWTNYKEFQRERYADGRKGARDVNIYTQVIDKYHPTNKVEFVEAFIKECKAQGKIPRFDQFLNKVNGEYVYTPGYEKLLLDFKLFDKQGNILPQNTVNPSIDMEVATRILNDEAKSGAKREEVSKKIVDELEQKYEVRNSSRDSEYMAAVNSGDMETAQKYVDQVAKENGYVLSAYHGTGEFFNTFMRGAEGIHLGNESQAKQVAHSRYDIRSKNTRYDWKDIENDIPKMNAETRWSLVGQAYILEDYYDADEYGKPFDGDINDDDAVLNYVKNEVDKYKDATKGYKYGNDVSFNLKTFDRKTGENVLHLYAKISNPFTINGDVLQWSPDRIASILLLRSEGATTMDKFYSDGVVNIDGSDIKLSAEHTRRLQAIADLKLKGESAWDEISNILTRHGYDGIKYLNQYEGDKQSYSYLALNPSDVKSADPVTYDDKGNVIPLTERFNKENEDIRYSPRETVISIGMSDEERAEILKDKVISVKEYKGEAFEKLEKYKNDIESLKHGLVTETLDRIASELHLYDKNLYNDEYQVEIEVNSNTFDESLNQGIKDAKRIVKMMPFLDIAVKNAVGLKVEKNQYYAETNGDKYIHLIGGYIDGDLFIPVRFGLKLQKNHQNLLHVVVDTEGIDKSIITIGESEEKNKDKVVGKDSQSEETGISSPRLSNISIPLLLKNVNSPILLRYIPDSFVTTEEKMGAKHDAIKKAQERTDRRNNKNYYDFLHKKENSPNKRAAKDMLKREATAFGFTVKNDVAFYDNESSIVRDLQAIVDGREMVGVPFTDIFKFTPEEQKKVDETNNGEKELFSTRDSEGRTLTSEQPKNPDVISSYRDLANSESEIIINALKNDAALVEQLGAKQSIEAYAREYGRLRELESQQIDLTKQLQKKDTTPSEREVILKKMVRLDRAILNKTTELTEMRNQRVIRDLLVNEWEKRDEMIAIGRAEERYQTRKVLEDKYGEELKALRAKSKAKQTEIRNRFEINKRKKNIETKAKALMKMILSPTEKKHIPSILINPITELLDSIDYWTPAEGRPTTKKSESLRTRFEDFRSAINEYQKQIDDGAEQIELMFDPEFLETVDDLCNSVKGIDNVNDMSVQDIIDLDHTLTELLHLISRGNKMIKAYHYQTINEAVEATAETMDKLDTLSSKTSAKGNLRTRLNAGMADSYAFGRYAGDGTKQIIDSLSKAFEDKVSKVKQAIEFTQEVLEPYKKDLKKWSKETHEFTLSTTDANGNPNKVSLTVGQMMELYLLNKREQARGHIYGGGIRVEDRKGRYTESVKVTEEDVQEIVNYLATVPGAIEVADKLQKYGATTITGWGNEASNLMYGFAKFTEPDYWQIRSDSSALKDNENTEAALNASMYRLQNMGRTKAVKKGANNAIYVGDVFDTWSKTIDEMTSYASILPSTTDAMRWWNSRIVNESGDAVRVKKLLESKLGTDMTRVFTETIKALNGGIMGTDSLESLVKVLTGKAKAAAVAGNLRVVLQQPTAYTRAAAVIEPKYLLKALTMKPNAKEAQEHSAIAWHKAQGFYSNGLAPSLRKLVIGDGSFGENLTEKSLWLAGKADDITWGALWNASKLKVEAENKALQKGSDAYWDEVNKVFSDIINNTQVVDTPLTKSTWMRGNGLGVFFTAFMAEPTKTYSMVMTAVEDLVRNPKSKAAQKSVALVGTVFAVNAAVNALAQALADAARDDDKEKSYWEKYVEKYTEDIKDNLNPLTYIPVVKDIFSLMQGYSNNNLAMQAAQNTVYAVQELQKIAKGTSKKTLFGQMETVAKAVSGWTGVPFGNVMRTLNSFGNIVGIDTFRRKKYTNSELGRNIALSINEGNFEEADQYMAELLQNVNGDAKKAQNYLVTYLAENDNEIDLWTTRYIEDPTVMDDAVSAMSDKYSADVIMSAIRKSANAQGEEVGSKSLANGTSVYTGNDINRTLEKGDVQKAQEMIDDVNKAYAAAGSNSTAKSTITTYWKPKYLAASGAERDKILRMLYSLRSNGKQMYTAKEIAKWK